MSRTSPKTSDSISWTVGGQGRDDAGRPKSQGCLIPRAHRAVHSTGILLTESTSSVYKFDGAQFQMGFEVEEDPDRVSFSKLFLDPVQVQEGQKLASFAHVSAEHSEEVLLHGISLYLGALKKRAVQHMRDILDEGMRSAPYPVPTTYRRH